jgi:putative membrane protein
MTSRVNGSFGRPPNARERATIIGLLLVGSLLSSIGAAFPENTWLQVGPVVLVAAFLLWIMRRWPLSRATWACLTLFLLLHLLAAHWTYSNVPYRDWLAVIGVDPTPITGPRNMFDRLVHFSFGLLIVRPIVEIESAYVGVDRRLANRLAILFVLASSAGYEIFEWTLAILISPEAADAYNGQQGDIFDAQKDMWMAFAGGVIALVMLQLTRRRASDS